MKFRIWLTEEARRETVSYVDITTENPAEQMTYIRDCLQTYGAIALDKVWIPRESIRLIMFIADDLKAHEPFSVVPGGKLN